MHSKGRCDSYGAVFSVTRREKMTEQLNVNGPPGIRN